MRTCLCIGCFIAAFFLAACENTEIDNNPLPIIWGETSFFPKTVERGRGLEVWKDVTFAGHGISGTIDKVTIRPEETIVENIVANKFSAKKQVFRNVTGEAEKAFVFAANGGLREIDENTDFSRLPAFRIGAYDGQDAQWRNGNKKLVLSKIASTNFSFQSFGKSEIDDFAAIENDKPILAIKKISFDEIYIPNIPQNNGDKVIIDNFRLADLASSFASAKVGSGAFMLKNGAFKATVENASFAGSILKELNIPNAPAVINFAFTGDGTVKQNYVNAAAVLDVVNLFDAKADIASAIKTDRFDVLNFSLTDKGAIKYMDNKTRQGLGLLAMFVPEIGPYLVQFLTTPDQTISGTIKLVPGQENISVKVEKAGSK